MARGMSLAEARKRQQSRPSRGRQISLRSQQTPQQELQRLQRQFRGSTDASERRKLRRRINTIQQSLGRRRGK